MASTTYVKRNGRWVAQKGPSKYIQDADTGFMQGRLGKGETLSNAEVSKKHWLAHSDDTKIRRVRKLFIRPKMGRRGHVRHYRPGQIVGRV